MKFLLMMMTDEASEAALLPAEMDRIVAQHAAVGRGLREAARWQFAARLHFGTQAITIRFRDGDYLICDGPFAETKEVLGGFYLIEADSKKEAVEWAKRLPLREQGAIEVRPARTGATWRGEIRGAQKYAVLFVADGARPLSREQVFRAIDSHYELSLDLAVRGGFVSSRALDPPAVATTLRWRDGQHLVSDGPFAETREFVAGYFVIACDSKDEAVEWAKRLMAGSEACEVRPLWE
jgi:hypothetical protein